MDHYHPKICTYHPEVASSSNTFTEETHNLHFNLFLSHVGNILLLKYLQYAKWHENYDQFRYIYTSLMLCWSSGLVCSCRGAMCIASLGNIRYKGNSDVYTPHCVYNPVHDAMQCIAGLPDVPVALLQAVQVGRYLCSDGTLILAVHRG